MVKQMSTDTRGTTGLNELVDAVSSASRALVGLTARSLAHVGADVTVSQYRALVLLATGGARRVRDLADLLNVNSSTATRLCDRLERKRLVERQPQPGDRRAVRIALTATGADLVDDVSIHRRGEIERIMVALDSDERRRVADGLGVLAGAVDEAAPDPPGAAGHGEGSA